MSRITRCGNCGAADAQESCWWCDGPLCRKCWQTPGHCGHPEAAAMNRAVAFAPSADVRRFMIMSALSDRRRPRSDTVL